MTNAAPSLANCSSDILNLYTPKTSGTRRVRAYRPPPIWGYGGEGEGEGEGKSESGGEGEGEEWSDNIESAREVYL